MDILKKITNWATGNSISFEKEDEIYEEVVKDINIINDLLDVLIENDDITLRYNQISMKSMKAFQQIKIRSLGNVKMDSERKIIRGNKK